LDGVLVPVPEAPVDREAVIEAVDVRVCEAVWLGLVVKVVVEDVVMVREAVTVPDREGVCVEVGSELPVGVGVQDSETVVLAVIVCVCEAVRVAVRVDEEVGTAVLVGVEVRAVVAVPVWVEEGVAVPV